VRGPFALSRFRADDAANYARGNDPETARRNQGHPDSRDSYTSDDLSGQHDTGDPGDQATDSYSAYTEFDAEVRGRIASIDELGSPAESRAATWGDHPRYYIGEDVAAEDGGEPYHSWEDDLPTREEPRAMTCGPDAEYWDEDEQAYKKFSDGSATDQAPTLTTASERIAQLESANQRLQSENTDLGKAVAELRSENIQFGRGMAELESENAELGKTVAELRTENTDLQRGFSALEARLERIEQTSTDKPSGDIVDRAHGGLDADSERPEHEQKRRLPSDEALLFGATGIGGAVTTAAYYLSYIRPDVAGITASLLATGAAGVAWMHKRREARHANRHKD
jgi:cell division protein FtsB